MSTKKILVLCYEYPPLGGGGGRVAAEVARSLKERGYEIRVVTGGMKHLPKHSLIDGVEVIRVRSGRQHEESCSVFEMLCWIIAAAPVAWKEACRWQPEVIHAHFAVPTGVVAWFLYYFLRIPYVLTIQLGDVPGGVPEQTEKLFKFLKPFTTPIWRAAVQVVAVSSFVADLIEKAYQRKPVIIFNGIDLSTIKFLPKKSTVPHLLIVSRLSVQKNLPVAIQALSLLRTLPWKLTIVGEGPLWKTLHAEVKCHGLEDRVTFCGWLPTEQVKTIMQTSDILLMPSLSEGLPVAGVEALAHGLAIVGSRIGGLKDILFDGENGFSFKLEERAVGMANALRPFLEDKNLLEQAQKKSLHLAHRFDWARLMDKYEEVLNPNISR